MDNLRQPINDIHTVRWQAPHLLICCTLSTLAFMARLIALLILEVGGWCYQILSPGSKSRWLIFPVYLSHKTKCPFVNLFIKFNPSSINKSLGDWHCHWLTEPKKHFLCDKCHKQTGRRGGLFLLKASLILIRDFWYYNYFAGLRWTRTSLTRINVKLKWLFTTLLYLLHFYHLLELGINVL